MSYTKEEAIRFQNEFRQAEFDISMEQVKEFIETVDDNYPDCYL